MWYFQVINVEALTAGYGVMTLEGYSTGWVLVYMYNKNCVGLTCNHVTNLVSNIKITQPYRIYLYYTQLSPRRHMITSRVYKPIYTVKSLYNLYYMGSSNGGLNSMCNAYWKGHCQLQINHRTYLTFKTTCTTISFLQDFHMCLNRVVPVTNEYVREPRSWTVPRHTGHQLQAATR